MTNFHHSSTLTYGERSPTKLSSDCGVLEDFTIAEIARLLCVSESTVYRRMREYNSSKLAFTDISDQELDHKVSIKDV